MAREQAAKEGALLLERAGRAIDTKERPAQIRRGRQVGEPCTFERTRPDAAQQGEPCFWRNALDSERQRTLWLREDAECELGQDAQGAEGAAVELRNVEPCDVLHHAPTRLEGFAHSVDAPD